MFLPSQVGLELFRPERDDQDPSYCLDEGFGPDFLQETVRRFSGNIGDFNKPDTYKDYEFRSFTLDIDSAGKSERPEWGEGKYQGETVDLFCLSPATMTRRVRHSEMQGDGREGDLSWHLVVTAELLWSRHVSSHSWLVS